MAVFVYCFQNDIWCKLQIQQHGFFFAHRYQHICAALTLFRTQKCSIRISHRLLLPHITNSNFVHTSTATWYYLSGLINRKHSHVLLLWCKMRWSENNMTKKNQTKHDAMQCHALGADFSIEREHKFWYFIETRYNSLTPMKEIARE